MGKIQEHVECALDDFVTDSKDIVPIDTRSLHDSIHWEESRSDNNTIEYSVIAGGSITEARPASQGGTYYAGIVESYSPYLLPPVNNFIDAIEGDTG